MKEQCRERSVDADQSGLKSLALVDDAEETEDDTAVCVNRTRCSVGSFDGIRWACLFN